MPELPDVENFHRYLKTHGMHKTIAGVEVKSAKILEGISAKDLEAAVTGHQFVETRRRGKHLLARLGSGDWVAFHFGMTGSFFYFEDLADDPKHDRLRFDFDGGGRLAFVNQRLLGRVGLTHDADVFIQEKELGADALSLDESGFATLLARKRGAVKSALMDQDTIAGIGNIFSDEILFQAGIHPKTDVDALDEAAVKNLYRAMRQVLEDAIKKGAGAEDFEDTLPDGWIIPERRKGGTCPRCGGDIASLKIQSRTAYYCPKCQPSQG